MEEKMNIRHVLRSGAIGAAVAALTLVALALASPDWSVPGERVLAGRLDLSSEGFAQYVSVLRTQFAIDSVFIMGWIVGWIGIAALVRTRNKMLGNITLVLGMIGPVLDFTENGMVWALVEGLQQDMSASTSWYLAWMTIRQLSYLISFAAAIVAAIGLWSRKPLDRVMSGIGTGLVAVAVAGMYIPAVALMSNLWWLVWFACGSLLLWRRAMEMNASAHP